jgi:hypothetical protein
MFPDDEVDDFNPVGGQWMFTQSAPTGLWEVVGPSVPGSYQAEYRASGGFDDPEGVSNRIIVVAPGGATLSASPELVGPGETVVVSWDTPGRPDAQDRIGFFRKGDPSDDQHLIDTWHDTRGQSRGSVEISAPSFGAYEARYFTKAVVEPAACSNVVTAEFRWPGSSGHGTPPHAKTQ